MPIYEYRRPDGSTFEIQQSFSEDPLTHDPESGVEVQRVLHAPAVHFKGKGFYNTDYGTRKRQRETAAAAEGSSSEGASTNGASSEGGSSQGKEGSSEAKDGKSSAEKSSPGKGSTEGSSSTKGSSGAKAAPAAGKG
jgi:putative FmdB family regulatory protein